MPTPAIPSLLRASALLMLCLSPGLATGAQGANPEAGVAGQAVIRGDDVVGAREEALQDAMEKAVTRAVTAELPPKTLNTYVRRVLKDRIYQRASRYVRRYTVAQEEKAGALYHVTLEIELARHALKREVQAIVDALPQRPFLRALLLVSTQDPTPGAERVEETLRKAWANEGVQLVDLPAGDTVHPVDVPEVGTDLSDATAKKLGTLSGADVVVRGHGAAASETTRATLTLHALATDGAVIGTVSLPKTTPVGEGPPREAPPLQQLAREGAAALLQLLLDRVGADPGAPTLVRLTLTNVRRSRDLKALAAALRAHVPGVRDVRQRSYRRRTAELEVVMQGSAKSLADALARRSFPNFKLKIKSVGEDSVSGTLKRP